jgi:hypothetical protein
MLAAMLSAGLARAIASAERLSDAFGKATRAAEGLAKALRLKRKYDPPHYGWRRPLNPEHYYMDDHGTIHRRVPKRDTSISARQWRKRRKVDPNLPLSPMEVTHYIAWSLGLNLSVGR